MKSFYTAAAIAAAPDAVADQRLRAMLADRVHDWAATGLLDLTHLLIVGPGDTEEDIVREVAFSPLVNPIDGRRFGSDGFVPGFEWLADLGGWFELVKTVGNSGFAFVLLIQDADGTDPELLRLCRSNANGGY